MSEQELKEYQEYQEWKEAPIWYCVKTTYHNSGKIESEIVRDEKSKLSLVIFGAEKPADGTYETMEATIYYTYHRSYAEAESQVKSMASI